jgi:hypothetical protein
MVPDSEHPILETVCVAIHGVGPSRPTIAP